MTTLSVIGEPLPGRDAAAHAAAARDLAHALAETAPRGCSSRLLLGSGTPLPDFANVRARAEHMPMRAGVLPLLWRSGATARPLDDEFVHAMTPLVPLRARQEEDAAQTSVVVPHALPWQVPGALSSAESRLYRAYVKRAMRLADAVLTPTHATADTLIAHFGVDAPVRVLPLAAPREYTAPDPAAQTTESVAARRTELGLPERYIVTTAQDDGHSRLDWVVDAVRNDPSLPDLVVLADAIGTAPSGTAAASTEPAGSVAGARVRTITAERLSDVGIILSGAEVLALPQPHLTAGYDLLGALSAGVPIVHSEDPAAAEPALEAGLSAVDGPGFARQLSRICSDASERARLSLFATDRSRAFAWSFTAWQLWELHAAI